MPLHGTIFFGLPGTSHLGTADQGFRAKSGCGEGLDRRRRRRPPPPNTPQNPPRSIIDASALSGFDNFHRPRHNTPQNHEDQTPPPRVPGLDRLRRTIQNAIPVAIPLNIPDQDSYEYYY